MSSRSPDRPRSPTQTTQTRQLLLEAAGHVFAEQGFRAATVREICRRAGTNIAAVNYHFGDKEGLYTQVLRHAHQCAFAKYPLDLNLPPGTPATERLRAFIRAFLLRVFDDTNLVWQGRLMSRELIEPTHALDVLVREDIHPKADQLRLILAEILHAKPGDELVRLCCFSVVSQCVFFHHCQPVLLRLFPEQKFRPKDIEHLATHVADFSLAALKNIARKTQS